MSDVDGQAPGETASPGGDGPITADLTLENKKDVESLGNDTPTETKEEKVEKKETTPEGEATQKPEGFQLSQQEYQQWKEGQKTLTTLVEALTGKKTKEGDPDPLQVLTEQVAKQGFQLDQSNWEKRHPEAIDNEAWIKANEERQDPTHKWHNLDFDEVWSLVKPAGDPKVDAAKRELNKSEKNPTDGSVPVFGTGEQIEDVTNFDKTIQKAMKDQLGYQDSDFDQ